jgi:hypothetical protein
MSVDISLTDDEALVLFDWLGRRSDDLAPDEKPTAEIIALWNLEALLERVLVAPFMSDYAEQLEAARARLTTY